MSKAHENTTIPFKTCLPVDRDTAFLAHYDVTANESLCDIPPLGSSEGGGNVGGEAIHQSVMPPVGGIYYDAMYNPVYHWIDGDWDSGGFLTDTLTFTGATEGEIESIKFEVGIEHSGYGAGFDFRYKDASGIDRNISFSNGPSETYIEAVFIPPVTTRLETLNASLIFWFYILKSWRLTVTLKGGGTTTTSSTDQSVYTLRPIEGRFGGGIAVEQGTTNLTNFDNWITASGTLTKNVLEAFYLRFVNSQVNNTHVMWNGATGLQVNCPVNSSITFSAYVKSNCKAQARIRENGSNGHVTTTNIDIPNTNGQWVRISGTCTALVNNPNLWLYLIDYRTFNEFGIIEIKDWQLEVKPFATSFTPTTRQNGLLRYDLSFDLNKDFTFSYWVKGVGRTTTWQDNYLINLADENQPRFDMSWNHGSATSIRININENWHVVDVGTPIGLPNVFYFIVVRKIGSTYKVWVFDEVKLLGTGTFIQGSVLGKSSLAFASLGNVLHTRSNIYDEVRLDKVARTDEEILNWHNSQSPFYPKGVHRIYL